MPLKNYQDLLVWQKAMELTEEVYRITGLLPKEELYVLTSQLRRASVSVPSNIAEGQARNSTKEFVNFLSIANGSKAEIETQLLLCVRLNYLNTVQIKTALSLCDEVGRMLHSLKNKLTTNH